VACSEGKGTYIIIGIISKAQCRKVMYNNRDIPREKRREEEKKNVK
jgi:hypothetical protein